MRAIVRKTAVLGADLIIGASAACAGGNLHSSKRHAPVSASAKYLVIRNAQLQIAATRKMILSNYRQYETALKNADAEAIAAFETPDFQMRQADGKIVNHSAADAMLRFTLGNVKTVHKACVHVDRITVASTSAIVFATQTFDATLTDKNQKLHRLVSTETSRDTWVLLNDAWKIRRTESLHSTTKVDGKAVRQ